MRNTEWQKPFFMDEFQILYYHTLIVHVSSPTHRDTQELNLLILFCANYFLSSEIKGLSLNYLTFSVEQDVLTSEILIIIIFLKGIKIRKETAYERKTKRQSMEGNYSHYS